MKTRTVGRTGLELSEIGFGAWGIGGGYYGEVPEREAIAAVHAYLDCGGNHIDTAYSYQRSEEVLGRALRSVPRDSYVLVSKTYAGCADPADIPKIRRELEVSLRGLGVDYLDIYMIHGAPADPGHMHALCEAFEKLKAEGLIRSIGASIPGPVVNDERVERTLQYIRSKRIDVLQFNYSVARQKLGRVFAEADAAGVGIICRWVLESGMLTGKYPPGHTFAWPDVRSRYQPVERDRFLDLAQTLAAKLPAGYPDPASVAIAFVRDNPHITGLILGATRSDQVRRNCAVDALPPLPPELAAWLQATYGPLNDLFNPSGEFEHLASRHGAETA